MRFTDIVLLSTADWDNPFWTNKQHVAVELARRGHRILYIDSLGIRRPTLKAHDRRRILRRVIRALKPPRRVRENLWVWSPLVLPAQGRPWVRGANRVLLRVGLKLWQTVLGVRSEILWTYSPLTTEFLRTSAFKAVVYHCVDDLKNWPGTPKSILESAEAALLRTANVVFTTSPRLYEERRILNSNTYYLPNVADFEHFSKARESNAEIPPDLAAISMPRLGFIGAISGVKLDFSLLKHIATEHPEWSIVLIGAVGVGDPWTNISEIAGIPNIHFLGPRPYARLPNYLKGFQIGLLPNRLNDYTASMFPMKFFEYLAAGLPVVSVNLPALRNYCDVVSIADSPTAFSQCIRDVLNGTGPTLEARVSCARRHTYVTRMDSMLEILTQSFE